MLMGEEMVGALNSVGIAKLFMLVGTEMDLEMGTTSKLMRRICLCITPAGTYMTGG